MSCSTGKRGHRSQAAARKFARELCSGAPARRHGGMNKARYAYLCEACGFWHLSRTPRREAA